MQNFRLSKSSLRDPRDRPTGSSTVDLKLYLDSHARTKSLRMADMSFGDDGARLLGEFLEKNRQVEALELRGNAISSEGFVNICEGLFGNNSLKSFSVEWNNIGSGTRGVEMLADFIAQNNSLEYLDLRNNKLNTSAAPSISEIVRNTISLSTLDLRWNELGNHGAKAILEALETNSKIQYIELGGNNITEDLIGQINSRLEHNRQKRGEWTGNNGNKTKGFERNQPSESRVNFRTQKIDSGRDHNQEMFEDLQKALTANAELERALNIESRKNAELKDKFYRDMDFSTRELQNKMDHILRENASLQATIKSFESDNNRLTKENGTLQDKIANLDAMHLKDIQTIEEGQRKIRALEQDLRGAENNYQTNLGRIVNEHALKAVELENNWDLRLKEVLRENEYLVERTRDLDAELQRLTEENRKLMFTVDDRIRDTSLRTREDERQKNQIVINELEGKLRTAEEDVYRLKRQLGDVEAEFDRRKEYADEKVRQANEEIRRLKNEVTINVDYYNKEKLKGESQQNEIMVRDNTIIKLESDIRELQKVLNGKEITYQEQIDLLRREQGDDAGRFEETKSTFTRRIADLERQNRQLNSELNKLRNDMQRVSELLVSNLSQTVYKTFSELK